MRTPLPGPARKCKDCDQQIPYPPAGLTPGEVRKREAYRRDRGLPAEVAIACLDSERKSASMCVKCGQEHYYQANSHMRPSS